MTDVIDAPGAETAQSTAVVGEVPPDDGTRPLEWAPVEPAPKKRRLGLWIGLGVGALVLAAGAASTVLIAPGTSVGGVAVGWLTPGAAAEKISTQLASTEITFTGAGGDQSITAAQLGASIDATALADQAFAAHPMWNLGSWMSDPLTAQVSLDTATAQNELRGILPDSYVDAVDAGVVFDQGTGAYVTTPAEAGTGVDLEALTASITSSLGTGAVEFSGDATAAPASVGDDAATATADSLNAMLGTIGFYIGDERTVPIEPAVAATWFDITDEDGELSVSADASAIQSVVDTLPETVNRAAVNAEVVTNSKGDALRTLTEGATGRELGDVSDAASDFAAQLENGDAVYQLDVNETDFTTTTLFRRIDLNLSTQTATLYENEAVVQSWLISSGLPATPTPTGNFTVFGYTSIQDMIGTDYVTKDVKWNTWFAPDIAFHGAYWHNNFGHQMSHGCVNMPEWQAEYVYEWTAMGTEVAVHW